MGTERKRTEKTVRKRRKTARKGNTKTATLRALQREQAAVALRLQGKSLSEIAVELGYSSKSSVHEAIVRSLSRAALANATKIEELRAEMVEQCRELEREGLEQWYRSVEDEVKEVTKETAIDAEDDPAEGDSGGDRVSKEFTRTVVGQSGNPALGTMILKAMERRANLLGLDAPKKIESASPLPRLIGVDRREFFAGVLKKLDKNEAKGA
jgi:hypothetical protein